MAQSSTSRWHGIERQDIHWNPTVIEERCVGCGMSVRPYLPAFITFLLLLLLLSRGGKTVLAAAPALSARDCESCIYTYPYSSGDQTVDSNSVPADPSPGVPVVRAVMFWMDGCPHCHKVLDNVLPPLQAQYGEQLEIHLIELASSQDVDRLMATTSDLGIPNEQVGVPFLIIGDRVLIGADQVSDQLPGLIETGLAAGGVDYPDIPTLADVLPSSPSAPDQERAASGSMLSNGFVLAIFILALMVIAFLFAVFSFLRGKTAGSAWQLAEWATPILAVIGLLVAGYLAYVETQLVSAVCGPVGDCNTVQSSQYARLFGWLPIGVLGLAGYLLILAVWSWKKFNPGRSPEMASLAIFFMAALGTLFSIYLTYLEPFVIRAVCLWCLTSAVIITLLLMLNLGPAVQARHQAKR